eukprot:scaffold126364_cov28-Tisochrysis_lutea.AAC.5
MGCDHISNTSNCFLGGGNTGKEEEREGEARGGEHEANVRGPTKVAAVGVPREAVRRAASAVVLYVARVAVGRVTRVAVRCVTRAAGASAGSGGFRERGRGGINEAACGQDRGGRRWRGL